MRFERKLRLLYIVFCVGLGLVWLRVGQLQLLEGSDWDAFAASARRTTQPLQAPRGRIVDAKGVVLARDVPVYQLSFVGWDWQRRGRVRCPSCGCVGFYRVEGTKTIRPPKHCACEKGRRDDEVEPSTLVALPCGDLTPLEVLLEMEPGTLARRAAERIAEVDRIVERFGDRLREDGVDEFLIGDKVEMRRADFLRRPFVFETGIPDEAVRLVHGDEVGCYRGFEIQTTLRRRYPQGDFAAPMLGFVTKVESETEYEALIEERPGRVSRISAVGRTGVERAYQWVLAGWPGERVMELDKDGQFTVEYSQQPPMQGRTLGLSTDVRASRVAEAAMERYAPREGYFPNPDGPASGGLVMMDAETGEILVWSEMPRYDPNTDLGDLYKEPPSEKEIAEQDGQWVPLTLPDGMDADVFRSEYVTPAPLAQSRVSDTAVEPGSTLKPLILLGMLESGRPILPSFRCGDLGGKPHCHNCSVVGLRMAICRSCNQYCAAAFRDYGPFNVYRVSVPRFMESLGFGQRPSPAMPEWRSGLWLRNWIDLDLKTIADRVLARFRARHPGVQIELVPTFSRNAPQTVGANPSLVVPMLADAVEQVYVESGATRIALRLGREATEGSTVVARFDVAALLQGPPRYAVQHDNERPKTWPLPLRRALRCASAIDGDVRIEGILARGGSVVLTGRFDRSVGRRSEDEPRTVRRDDGRNIAIGQGPVLATPIQMARAMAALANGGRLVTPTVVSQIDGQPVRRDAPVRLGWSQHHLDEIRAGMRDVVAHPRGTASSAGFRHVNARVYGKTGTAQIGGDWRRGPRGSHEDAWHHWFVGFAEAPGRRTVAFACVLHARTEAAAGMTSARAVADTLAWWFGDEKR